MLNHGVFVLRSKIRCLSIRGEMSSQTKGYFDIMCSEHRGQHYPIMHVHERSLSVLACRYVDEVIIGAPWEVTKDMVSKQTEHI